ncbi:hypothetical protein [Rhizobium etli]|nr:hypothetical protein [Rhizobium etli]
MNKVARRSSRRSLDDMAGIGTLLAATCRLVQASMLTISGMGLNWSIAMDQSAADMVSKVCIEILPPEREDTCTPDAAICPCCRKLRPASSMDDDGCGICDECLAP